MAQGPAPEECGVSTPTTPPESKCELVDYVEGGDVDFKFHLLIFQWTRSSSGHVPFVYRLRVHVAYLGQVHSVLRRWYRGKAAERDGEQTKECYLRERIDCNLQI